jgi:hypothetical protein
MNCSGKNTNKNNSNMRTRYILFLLPFFIFWGVGTTLHAQNWPAFTVIAWVDAIYAADGRDPLGQMPDGYGNGFEGRWRVKATLNGIPGLNTNISNCGCNNSLPCTCDGVGERIIKVNDARWKEWNFGYDQQNAGLLGFQYINIPSNTTIDLNGSFWLDLNLKAWESDECGSDDTFDNNCGEHKSDDNYTNGTYTAYLKDLNGNLGDNYIVNMPWPNVWAVEFRVAYLVDPIQTGQNIRIGFFSGPGNTNFQTSQEFCQGKNVTYQVPLRPGFRGGSYSWSYKNSAGQWVFDQNTNTEYLTKTVGTKILEYRATPINDNTNKIKVWVRNPTTPSNMSNYTVFSVPSKSDITLTAPLVCGTDKGTISVNVANPVGTYSVSLYNANITSESELNNATYLTQNNVSTFPYQFPSTYAAGTYTVVVRGPNQTTFGCLEYKTVSITSVPRPTISLAGTQPLCSGQKGSLTVTYNTAANGLINSVRYQLVKDGANLGSPVTVNGTGFLNTVIPAYTFTNLDPGSYNVVATNNQGCSATTTTPVTINSAPAALSLTLSAPNFSTYNAVCYGDPIPLTIATSGGKSPYILSIPGQNNITTSDNTTIVNYSTLVNTTLFVAMRDANNCALLKSIQLKVPPSPLALNITTINPSFSCTANGSIIVSGAGGTGSYEYELDNDGYGNTAFLGGVNTGPHTVRVRDLTGCVATQEVFVPASGYDPVVSYFKSDISCFGQVDGAIQMSVVGGTIPITFELFQNNTSLGLGPDFYSLSAGDYTVRFSDETNCVIFTDITIVEPQPIEIVDVVQDGPLCSGLDATAKVYIRGRANGIANDLFLNYSLDGGGTWAEVFDTEDDGDLINFSLNFTPPTSYQIQVRQNSCYSNTFNFTAFNPTPLALSLDQVVPTSCTANQDGSLSLNVSGGRPPYIVVLGRYENGSSWLDIAETDTLRGGEGVYTFSGLQTSVSGGFMDYTGGYVFLVFDQGSTVSPCLKSYPSGYYQDGMFEPITLGAADPVQIVSAESIGDDINCTGSNGQIQVVATNGTQPYKFSLGGTVYQNSDILTGAGTTNEVYVQDKFGCTAGPVTVDIPQAPSELNFTVDILHQVSDCRNGQVEVRIYDGIPPYQVTLAPTNEYQSICYEGATGAISRITSNSATVLFSDLEVGEYTICVKDAITCQTDQAFMITKADSLKIEVAQHTYESCFGFSDGSATIAVSGGYPPYTITKNFGDPVIGATATYDSLSYGNYLYSVVDHEGCDDYVSDSISYGKVILLINTSTPPPCADLPLGTVTVAPYNGTAPYSCYWQDSPGTVFTLAEAESVTRTNLPVTELFFNVTDADGCKQTLQAVLVGPDFVSGESEIVPAACGGVANGSAAIIPFGGTAPYQYSLDSISYQTDSIFNGLAAGVYTVYIRDINGCNGAHTFTVGTQIVLEAEVSSFPASCANGNNGALDAQVINGISPYQYSLNGTNYGNSGNFTGLTPGNYTVYFRDNQGCLGTKDTLVSSPSAITLSSFTQIPVTCPGGSDGSLTFNVSGGTGAYTYSIDGGATFQASKTFSNLPGGNYVLNVKDAIGCQQSFQGIVLNQPAPLTATVQIDQIASCGLSVGAASVTVTGGTPNANAPFYAYEWDNLPYLNLPVWTSVPPGAHSIKVTDSKGCTTTQAFTMTQSPALTAGLDAVTPDTCARQHGAISLSVLTGSAPYVYNWSTGDQTSDPLLENLPAGNYSITITDAFQCSVVLQTSVNEIEGPGLNLQSVTNSICADGLGQITVQANSGTLPYTYAWSHNAALNTPSANNLTQGNYTVTVSDANGCSASLSQSIQYIQGPQSGSATVLDAACDQNNGQITASFNGGTLPYSFTWSHDDALNDPIAAPLAPGTYTVAVSDANNCTLTLTETIGNLPGPSLSAGPGNTSACNTPNGSVSVTTTSGTAPYTYTWSHNALLNSPTASNLLAGDYTVTVTDARGCTSTLTQTVGSVSGPAIASLDATNSLCADGQGSLSATLTPDLGTAPFTYAWNHDNSQTGPSVTDLFAGTYTVTVTDANQCTAVKSAQIDLVAGARIDNISVQNSLCTDGNGGLTVTITQGAAAYTLQWSHDPAETGATLQNLSAGTYTVTVSDDNGCSDVQTAVVEFKTAPVFAAPTVQNTSCGLAAGSISTQLTGGTPAYTYTWSHNPNASGNNQNALPEGTYSVTVTDANGCTDTTEATITNQPAPTIELGTVVSDNCGQSVGSISVTATGVGPLSYSWSHNALVQQAQALFLLSGTYTVTVTDANGCSSNLSAEVANLSGVTAISQATNSLCTDGNGAMTVTANGTATPFQYSWSHNALLPDATATNLPAGVYTVTITDSNGCTVTQTETVALQGAPSITAQTTQSACSSATGTISLQTSGGTQPFVYTWSHDPDLNNTQALNLAAATYSVTISDANGCSATTSVEITQTPAPQNITSSATDAGCGLNNGAVSVNIGTGTAPFTYAWAHNPALTGNSADNLSAGTYPLTITDANGCTALSVPTVSNIGAPDVTLQTAVNAYCGLANGSAAISANGGALPYTIQWVATTNLNNPIGSSTAVSNLGAGAYIVSVTDAAGCKRFLQVDISGTPGFTLTANAQDASCFGLSNGNIGAVTSNGGTPPFQYSWSNGVLTQNLNNQAAGTFTVTATDALGCTQTATATIAQKPAVVVTAVNIVKPTCANYSNGAILVNANGGNGGFSYAWNSGVMNNAQSNLSAGIYTVTATDQNGCTGFLSVPLNDPPPISLSFTPVDPLCFGDNTGSITASVTGGNGGFQYLWSNGQTTPIALSVGTGTYTVTVTDNNVCSSSASTTLQAPTQITVSANAGSPACGTAPSGQITALASGGAGALQYAWNDPMGQTTATAISLSAGQYQVIITDGNGCTASAQATVNAAPAVNAAVSQISPVSCPGSTDGVLQATATGGTGAFSYTWSDPAAQTSAQASNLAPGAYSVTIQDAVGCTAQAGGSLQAANDYVVNISSATGPTCNGLSNGSITLFIPGNTSGFTFTWNDPAGQNTQNAQNLAPGVYTVTVTNANGCTKTASATVPNTAAVSLNAGTISGPLCFGQSNGSAQAIASGGTGNFTYIWNDPQNQQTATAFALASGSYTVTATDQNGCSATLQVVVPTTTQVLAQISATNAPLCAGQSNGSATANGNGGTGTYTWLWSNNGQTTQTATNLLPGNYTVTVSDQNGCTATATTTVSPTPALNLSLVSNVSPTCSGLSNGTLTVSGAGGTGALAYAWSTTPTQNSAVANNLAAGAYTVTLSDQNGCTATNTYTVNATNAISLNFSASNPVCASSPSGILTASASGGTSNYNYVWSNGQSTATASNLTSGAYTVTVTDQNGCTASASSTLSSTNPAINSSVFNSVATGCFGGQGGGITLSASGGTGLLQFAWSNGSTGFQQNNLSAGSYTVTITDAVGCSNTLTAAVQNGPVFTVELGTADTSICGGDALLYELPGNNIGFAWAGPNNFTATGASVILQNSGVYQVTASHPAGCTDTDQINVTISPDPMAAFFVIATEVVQGDTIVAVEVSWPAPSNVEWIFDPGQVEFIGQDLNQYFFKFLTLGDVNLGMRANVGTCSDAIYKTIKVYATPTQLPPLVDRSELVQFIATPNPSSGVFNIIVEFEEDQQAVLSIYRANGQPVDRRILQGAKVYNQAFNIAQPGIYSAILQVENRKYSISILVLE